MSDLLRPQTFEDFIGQPKLKDFLQIKIHGAISRDDSLSHILLFGPPGTGKTSMAALIAQEMGSEFESLIMPIKPKSFQRIIQQFEGILFLDEIHRMSVKDQEDLLPLLEDGYLQLENGQKIQTDYLTIIGGTTELNKVIAPLLNRFLIPPFDEYEDEDMGKIVQSMANKLNVLITYEQSFILGRATGGIPRNAKHLIEMMRDLETDSIDLVLKKCRVTEDGLTEMHIRYLKVLKDCGGVAGLEIIGSHLGLSKTSLIDLEKLLIKRKMIEYTKSGRSLNTIGFKILKGTH